MYLHEMAYSIQQAITKCNGLAKRFIEHFEKAYNDSVFSNNFHHHCHEMQVWWNDAKDIRLKTNNKKVSNTNLMDWFFTNGSTPEEFFTDETMIDVYNEFIIEILHNRENADIEKILREILIKYGA